MCIGDQLCNKYNKNVRIHHQVLVIGPLNKITRETTPDMTKSTDSTVRHNKVKLCVDIHVCKFKGISKGRKRDKDKEPHAVQCHLCQHWFHAECIGEKDGDIINTWTCPSLPHYA